MLNPPPKKIPGYATGVFCNGRFSENHKGEEWMGCAKHFRRAQTLCAGMEEDFVCELFPG